MKIISFSGVDGSGKTTQRELLQKYLEDKGYTVAYFHATEFSLANRLGRKAKGKNNFTPGEEPAVVKAGFFSSLLRIIFLAIDSVRFQKYEYCLEKAGVNVIISDRFFQDSLLNVCFLSKNPIITFFVRLLSNAVPIPECSFYLKLTSEDILKRDRVPEQGRAYLDAKIALYNRPPFPWIIHILDATQSPGTIHQEALGMLGDI